MAGDRILDLDLDTLPAVQQPQKPEALTEEQRGILKGKIVASKAIIADLEEMDTQTVYMLLQMSKLSISSLTEAIVSIFDRKAERYRKALAGFEESLARGEI